MNIYEHLINLKSSGQKGLAILIDPDDTDLNKLEKLIHISLDANVDYFFVGGSIILKDRMDPVIKMLKSQNKIPVIIFPGNPNQIHQDADALLLLSLISGRNPDLLIGKHVESAQKMKASQLEIIPTGYVLIDGGKKTAVSYVSHTQAIPREEINIAVSTALAGQLLGMKTIYLEAGSGARYHVPENMIASVNEAIDIPLIVGGGITTGTQASQVIEAGADLIVVGNAVEKNPELIIDLSIAVHAHKSLAT